MLCMFCMKSFKFNYRGLNLLFGSYKSQRSGKVPGVGLVHAPFALLPMPFPENQWRQAVELTPIFSELVDRVSLDGKFLQESLSRYAFFSLHRIQTKSNTFYFFFINLLNKASILLFWTQQGKSLPSWNVSDKLHYFNLLGYYCCIIVLMLFNLAAICNPPWLISSDF